MTWKQHINYYLDFPTELPKLKFRPRFLLCSCSKSPASRQHTCAELSACIHDTYKHMAFCNGGRSEDPAAVRSNTMCNMLKAHTKDAHTVCSGTYSKDVERFRKNRSANFVRDVLMSKHKLTPSYE